MRRSRRRYMLILPLLCGCLWAAGSSPARAAEAEGEVLDYGKVYAIQYRAFRMNHEFAVGMTFLPMDAFYKFFAGTFHYVLHFDDLWAWENHFSFAKYLDVDTGLTAELNNRWHVSPTDTPKIDYYIDTNLMLKPLYGKMVLFDRWVIYSESYFLLGIGAIHVTSAFFPAVDVGAGMRVFLSDTISLRFEVRDYVYLEEKGVENALSFGIVFCYNGFAEDRKVIPEEEVEATAREVKP